MGNRKLGLRFYFCTFFPLQESETLFNGIMYNIILLNLWTLTIIQMWTSAFREWMCQGGESVCDVNLLDPNVYEHGRTHAFLIWDYHIRNMKIHSFFYNKNVNLIAMYIVMVLTVIYLIFRPDDMKARSSGRKAAKLVDDKLNDTERTSINDED